MSSINTRTKVAPVFTHNGARAERNSAFDQLRRTVMTCMLWEDRFYENGEAVAERIKRLVHSVNLHEAATIAMYARNEMKLRHVPLLIVREMARHPQLKHSPRVVSQTLAEVIQRADELSEFLAIYWAEGKCPLSKQVKLGLAAAFQKFSEYELAKYNRNKDIRLKDVLFLCHSKPVDVKDHAGWTKAHRTEHNAKMAWVEKNRPGQTIKYERGFTDGELLYGKLIYDQLATPDTWEVELSQSQNKYASWNRLLINQKLGDLAFLRNLRNMKEAGISDGMLKGYGDVRRWGRVLPFRFVAAARMNPSLEHYIEPWMLKSMENQPKLPGRTIFLIDVSGSMFGTKVSAKSDLDRFDAAAALTVLGRELCNEVTVMSFSTDVVEVPARRGFGLIDAIRDSQRHGGTYLGKALTIANALPHDRIIVITDEQSADTIRFPLKNAYIVDVGGYERGIKYDGNVTRISGWSEAVFDFIIELESDRL